MAATAALVSLAANIGLPLIQRVLGQRFGQQKAALAVEVVQRIADRAGVPVDRLPDMAEPGGAEQDVLREAMLEVEAELPERLALYADELDLKGQIFAGETGWRSAWRPLGMYFVVFLWFWQIVGLHALNAVFKTALPPADWGPLVTFTGLYMSLYMGGHTAKEVMASWTGRGVR